jgi:hypothetical protein
MFKTLFLAVCFIVAMVLPVIKFIINMYIFLFLLVNDNFDLFIKYYYYYYSSNKLPSFCILFLRFVSFSLFVYALQLAFGLLNLHVNK